MNKGHLVTAVAKRLGVTHTEARENVDAVLEEIARALVRAEDVQITGFGSFSVRNHALRKAHNPQTGGTVWIPARAMVRFRAGARLLEHVRGSMVALEGGLVVGKAPKSVKEKDA